MEGHFCVPITGEIDERYFPVDQEKVDHLRPARGGADFRQVFPVDQGIDQRGFAHIGLAGYGQLRKSPLGIFGGFGGALYEFGG
jgi:hypothetical protein